LERICSIDPSGRQLVGVEIRAAKGLAIPPCGLRYIDSFGSQFE
jgi:hypothetical protein